MTMQLEEGRFPMSEPIPSAIPHLYNGILILQRGDGYWNATAMCKANDKLWGNYWRNEQTQEFLQALSSDMRIRITELVQVRQGGNPVLQGTWVHRRVAINLAQWCNPVFAVRVSGWVEDLLTRGRVELSQAVPLIPAWSNRITPAFETHRRHIIMNCPDGAWSVLTAALGETLMTENEMLRHYLPIEHHDLPDGSIGKMYRKYREGKAWVCSGYLAPLVLPNWRKSDGVDITVSVTVYDADERRHFERWLNRQYFPDHLPDYMERKFPQQQYGLTSASAADNSSRRVTGRRASLPTYVLRQIDEAGGYIPVTSQLGRPPAQGLLFDGSEEP